MKAVFLSSSTSETKKYADGFASVGHSYAWIPYDLGLDEQGMYTAAVKESPDLIVYIGSRWPPQVSTATLAKLNAEVAPSVHICSDAADSPWHDMLMEYHYAGAFALQVAIDGSPRWPLHDSQMTALTPIDPRHFEGLLPHAERPVLCGYAGNPGANGSYRRELLSTLCFGQLLTVRLRDADANGYQACCDFIKSCRSVVNTPHTGTQTAMHVKGRVVEAGLAGACLIEMVGSPTSEWFIPGVDYLEYHNVAEAGDIARRLKDSPEESQKYGERLRAKVLAAHTPASFWEKVLERVKR